MKTKGFTLLEVMVALAIFATAAVALTKLGMQSTANAVLRTKAQFVAMNEAAMMQINREWMQGTSSKQVTSQGETWQVDKTAQATISPNVQRIEIQISRFDPQQNKVEAGITHMVFFNYPPKENVS